MRILPTSPNRYAHSSQTSRQAALAGVSPASTVILKLGARLARGEISVTAHDALVAGLKAYLSDRAAEQQKILDELADSLRHGEDL